MKWGIARVGLAGLVVIAGAACERLSPPAAQSAAPAQLAQSAVPDMRGYAGQTYVQFTAQTGMERYAVSALGLSDAEQARFERAMAVPAPAPIAAGGGAEALVFSGCAETGCGDGIAVVAVDLATGGAFVGIRDAEGADELAPNVRLEALLRLTSPTRRWDDPVRTAPEAAAP